MWIIGCIKAIPIVALVSSSSVATRSPFHIHLLYAPPKKNFLLNLSLLFSSFLFFPFFPSSSFFFLKKNQAFEHTQEKVEDIQQRDIYGQQMQRQDRILQLLTRRQEEDARALNMAEVAYRAANQAVEHRREFDLNDPNALKAERPLPGPGDVIDDARLGVSSMQYFEGEDSLGSARSDLQQQQIREWTKEAVTAHTAQRQQAAAEKAAGEALLVRQTEQTALLLEHQAAARHADMRRNKAENLDLLAQQKASAAAKIAEEQRQDYVDVMSTFQSDLLLDTPESGYNARGNIKQTTEFKGFTAAHLASIRADQRQQEGEVAQSRFLKANEFNAYAAQEQKAARAAHLAERAEARARAALRKQTVSDNTILATMKTSNIISKNEVTGGFFAQFGTSSR